MSILSINYRVTQGDYGMAVVEATGRATSDERVALESGVVTRWQLVPYPAARGAVFKALDGSNVVTTSVTLPTGAVYECVKTAAEINPMAPAQGSSFPHAGKVIIRFMVRWQQVGRLPQ